MEATHGVDVGSTMTSSATSDEATSVSPSCSSAACIHEQGLRKALEQLNHLLQEDNKMLTDQLLQEQMARMDLENRLMEASSQAKYEHRMHAEYKRNSEDLKRDLDVMQLKVFQLEFELSEAMAKQSGAGDFIDLKLSESRIAELEVRLRETENEVDFYKSQIEEFKTKILDMNREKEWMISFDDHLKMIKSSEDFLKKSFLADSRLNKEITLPELKNSKEGPVSNNLMPASSAASLPINTPDLPDISLLLLPAPTPCPVRCVTPGDVQPLSRISWSSNEDMDATDGQQRVTSAGVDCRRTAKPRIAPKPKHLQKKDNAVVESVHLNDLSLGSSADDVIDEEEAVSFSQETHSAPLKVPSRPKGPKRRNPTSNLLRKIAST
ncbi:hypothetical protein CAPTEDRAFT_192515 [Capitella teleta]|uniref:Uncharacterized protein n=1 Tax=Capitella teleta TaxID=283909 RepID=R7UZB4_CAPTE|nr:hypothetical protein CAPTEDRAFT_192515 [Capitella teleta]|eukprot:ELU09297.1 hypothetical protein CAPTEDRAFT_192515 [Capitella teleta]